MNKDIQQAIDSFRQLADRYDKPERYYNGQHDLSFATEKFQNTFGVLPEGVRTRFAERKVENGKWKVSDKAVFRIR